ncbi:MAG: hypothetical protein H0V65_04505 [Chitinophagales bacterium]|nr:hypothetical protein [Chitinophagales bacterium]
MHYSAPKCLLFVLGIQKPEKRLKNTFHEGFMKVFENLKSFKMEGSLECWIRRIMVNTAIEKYRKNSHFTYHYMSLSFWATTCFCICFRILWVFKG